MSQLREREDSPFNGRQLRDLHVRGELVGFPSHMARNPTIKRGGVYGTRRVRARYETIGRMMAAVATATGTRSSRFGAVLREGERVMPLELFFDLVFVLAITQCTALMSHHPTWEGLAQGLLVLGMLWWSWTGYSWLTSVIDPEEGAVRLVMFGAMAALL